MAEENENVEETIDNPEYDDEGNPIIENEGIKDEGTNDSGTKNNESDDNDSDEDEGAEDEDIEEDVDNLEVPTRNFNADQIIKRQKKTIEKLRSKKNEDEDIDNDDDDDGNIKDDKDIQKEINNQVKPILDHLKKDSDEGELRELFSSDPNSKKYEKRIRKYMEHPDYQNVPPSVIYHHLAFKDGSSNSEADDKARKVADKEAAQNRSVGRDIKPLNTKAGKDVPSAEEIDNMDEEAFDALQENALRGNFIK